MASPVVGGTEKGSTRHVLPRGRALCLPLVVNQEREASAVAWVHALAVLHDVGTKDASLAALFVLQLVGHINTSFQHLQASIARWQA